MVCSTYFDVGFCAMYIMCHTYFCSIINICSLYIFIKVSTAKHFAMLLDCSSAAVLTEKLKTCFFIFSSKIPLSYLKHVQ